MIICGIPTIIVIIIIIMMRFIVSHSKHSHHRRRQHHHCHPHQHFTETNHSSMPFPRHNSHRNATKLKFRQKSLRDGAQVDLLHLLLLQFMHAQPLFIRLCGLCHQAVVCKAHPVPWRSRCQSRCHVIDSTATTATIAGIYGHKCTFPALRAFHSSLRQRVKQYLGMG